MRLSVYEASKKLGISEAAVRQRAYRGTLEYEKEQDGRLYVYVTPQDMLHNGARNNTQHVASDDSQTLRSEYVTALKSQIESLEADKQELQRDKEALEQDKVHLREESVRKDHIIMTLSQKIPALESPAADAEEVVEARESTLSGSDESSNGAVHPDSADGKIQPPWWRRFFGL